MIEFKLVTLSAIEWAHSGIAVATVRAGAVAVLDCTTLRAEERAAAQRSLADLLGRAPAGAVIGLRMRPEDVPANRGLLGLLAGRPHWLVLARWREASLRHDVESVCREPGRAVWLEATDGTQIDATDEALPFHGWVARGSECGGFVGRTSAFVLAQRLARQGRPFLVQGGIGLHSAAACHVAGAAGVVLDDQLLLMRESPLSEPMRAALARLDGTDVRLVGERLGASVRLAVRPDLPGAGELAASADRLGAEDVEPSAAAARWLALAEEKLGWGPASRSAWPVGQAVARAAEYAARHRTTGRFLAALRDAIAEHIAIARSTNVLGPDSPLARSHGTTYPIVQGPMTRVSDRTAFAAAVADAGALPLLAMALMREPELGALLREARERLGDKPWGVGILGFVPPDARREQLAVITEVRPPFALISGGRPDQAAELERHGVATYLHAPTPTLLRIFLENGVRRFIFEGSECGGHYGPFTSFALWDATIDALLEERSDATKPPLHIVFAGGIHDARSAAMVAAMAAPLAAAGTRVGVLMGTAYLFTTEATSTGAIVEGYQRLAATCDRTVTLETGPGHLIRCIPTPFVDGFNRAYTELQRANRSTQEVMDELGLLLLGRSRIAAKGIERDQGGALDRVPHEAQVERGLYMIGDVATLRSSVGDMRSLHADVSSGSLHLLRGAAATAASEPRHRQAAPAEIAIVGAACLLPSAPNLDAYWRNLLGKVSAIREIPIERWDYRLYYDPDPRAEDRIYSKWGGFIDDLPFDPVRYGIPPRSLKSICIPQLLSLEVSRQALDDAGYASGRFDRRNTAVIFAVGGMADLEYGYITRTMLPLCVDQTSPSTLERLPTWTEESYAGVLPNVISGRVANFFDLGGPNYAVDSACSSSLTAIDAAVAELRSGRSNMALVGAVDFEQTPYCYMGFSKSRALSPRGRADVFDKRADGIVIGEGVVVLVLKRLADAEHDGDRIRAVIQGVAGSSDGKGLGLTAPKSAGQRVAIERVYERAGIAPSAIAMYEAHGTGTAVGDRTELETIQTFLRDAGAGSRSCAIGSAKSLIGHTKGVAGMAGLLKAMCALEHRVLPAHAGVEQPLDPLEDESSPLYLLAQPQPWLDEDAPRRAGVSAFGFGGTNCHMLLEEYRGDASAPVLGAADWPAELVIVRAANRADLIAALEQLGRALVAQGSAVRLCDLAFTCALAAAARRAADPCACFVVESREQLAQAIEHALASLRGAEALPSIARSRVRAEVAEHAGRIAFLFPGQGAQYTSMARELALFVPEIRSAFEHGDRCFKGAYRQRFSRFVFPPAAFNDAALERQHAELVATRVAQPAIGIVSAGMLDLASRLGLRAELVAGHSYGELVALHAAGVLSRDDLLHLSEIRGRLMQESVTTPGTMAAVMLPREALQAALAAFPSVCIANHNAPDQCVISGEKGAVAAAVEALRAGGARVQELPVATAFHSPLMTPVAAPFAAAIDRVAFASPEIAVYANANAEAYPSEPITARALIARQIQSPVEFVSLVRRMHDDGARVFVELGPRSTLSGMVRRILGAQPHVTVAFDGEGGGIAGLLHALATLSSHGVEWDPCALFAHRAVRSLDLRALAAARPSAGSPGWLINGSYIRRANEELGALGERRWLDQDTEREPAPIPVVDGDDPVAVYRDYQQTMREFLQMQERVTTQWLQRMDGANGVSGVHVGEVKKPIKALGAKATQETQATPAAQATQATQATAAVSRATELPKAEELRTTIISLVSQRTGYSTDILDLNQDMEAHLGIDSIKRIEILEGLFRGLPERLGGRLQSSMDRISRIKTMNGLVDIVLRTSETMVDEEKQATGPAAPTATTKAGPTTARAAERCPRYVMRAEPRPLTQTTGVGGVSGLFIVTDDGLGAAAAVAAWLTESGAHAVVLSPNDLAHAERVAARIEEARERHGPVAGILHLASLIPTAAGDVDSARRGLLAGTRGLFLVLRASAGDLGGERGRRIPVFAATRMGGLWLRGGVGESVAGAGCHGILQCLAREYPRCVTRVIDFDEGANTPGAITERIAAELTCYAAEPEVGYPGGERVVFTVAEAPLNEVAPNAGWEPREGWVILVTGGARGITAEITCRLARPGVHLVLVGRGQLADQADTGEDADAMRSHAIAEAREAGRTPVPAVIDAQIKDRLNARSRREAVERLRSLGSTVEYHSMDVRDAAALEALVADVYARHGRLNAVVHGAGIIEDHLLEGKQVESFDRVFETKAHSTLALMRALRPEGLSWIVFFGSVTGRFGNRGQGDYAAANEAMTRIAWQLDARWPSARVVTIQWGPWRDVGMAGPGALKLLAAQGMAPIETQAGVDFFVAELARGEKGAGEVIGGAGPWYTANVAKASD